MAVTEGKPAPVFSALAASGGYALARDGVALKTPAGLPLIVPTQALADAIVGEMRALGGKLDAAKMPLMQMAMTGIDVIGKNRAIVVNQLVAYGESELLCHRAEGDDALAAKQQQVWQPLLDWCAQRFGASLNIGTGIMPVHQPPENVQALRKAVTGYDDFHLAGLGQAAGVAGSLVLALALAEKQLTPEQLFDAAELDATHQMEHWGEDAEVTARHAGIRHDLALCERWFALLAN
jgi:chaperone required for assembly of F1-ATPase